MTSSPIGSADTTSPAPSSSPKRGLALTLLPDTFGICRLHPRTRLPRWLFRSPYFAVTRSRDELSVVCRQDLIPPHLPSQRDWRALKVLGPLDFALVGVIASLTVPLARARISVFTISTFDTDYLLVRAAKLERAIEVLQAAGHELRDEPAPVEAGPEPMIDASADADSEENESDAEVGAPASAAGMAEPAEPTEAAEDQDDTQVVAVMADEAVAPPAPEPAPPAPLGPTITTPFSLNLEPFELDAPAPTPPRLPEPVAEAPQAAAAADAVPAKNELGEQTGASAPPPPMAAPAAALPPLPADEVPLDDDEDFDSEGLFTGAIPQHAVETTDDTFESIGISAPIRQTIEAIGFIHPTPIQAAVIPLALEGGDLIGLAETGSGKTGAFGLPLAERLTHGHGLRGLILCPTREIALQTKAFLDIFGKDHQLYTALIIGGVKMGPQIDALRRAPDIVVATPGRLCDHLRRRTVRLDQLQELVLDEADHMLDLGFLPQIQEILEALPQDHRTMMFSATMPPPIERLANRFMRDPYMIDLRPVGHVAAGIEHRLYLVREDDKKRCLIELLKQNTGSTLIFTRRRLHAEWLARQLETAGLPVDRIHSDRTQAQRVRALRGFREGRFRILVATDVAARGIDVPRLQHVINFGVPENVEDYVHRAGRTARGAAVGVVSTIATWLDKAAVADIERILGVTIPRFEAPGVAAYQELKRRPTVRKRRLL